MSTPSSPSPSPVRDNNPANEVARMIQHGLVSTDPIAGVVSGLSTAASALGSLQGSRMNATLHARRIAIRYRLSAPYNRQMEEYGVEDAANRDLLAYGVLLSILQLVNGFIVATGPYKDNIKKFCTAVLLSPKLDFYKGTSPIDRVMSVITRIGTSVPDNFATDAHIRKVVKEHISDEMTQQRSRMKKQIKESIQSETSIYELANTMIDGTQCVVTVDMGARLALLRKIYLEPGMADSKFWSNVDERLRLVREQTNRNTDQIAAFFTVALNEDHARYGCEAESQGHASNPWQSGVDDIMAEGSPHISAPGMTPTTSGPNADVE